jgi:hypothetical protein
METNRFLGVAELQHGLAAKRRILDRFPEGVPDREATADLVYRYYVQEARQRAAAARNERRPQEAATFLEFAALTEAEGLRAAGARFRAWALERAGTRSFSARLGEWLRWFGTGLGGLRRNLSSSASERKRPR